MSYEFADKLVLRRGLFHPLVVAGHSGGWALAEARQEASSLTVVDGNCTLQNAPHYEAEVEIDLAGERMRLGVVKGVEQIREQIQILTAVSKLLHRRVTEQKRWPTVVSI